MASDLETNLINGGLSPAAAKVISNAIANLATGRTNIGRQLADATPTDRMRMIDSNTRRYLLTNLDYPTDDPFRSRVRSTASQFKPRTSPHPYQDSQPASANPTLDTQTVAAGQFVSVAAGTSNEVAQSEVTLNVKQAGGSHARLNPATGQVESVPISVEFEPDGLFEAEVREEAGGTVIKIRVVNTALRQMLAYRFAATTKITDSFGGSSGLYVEDSLVAPGRAFVLISE